jgi:hypothetical protein
MFAPKFTLRLPAKEIVTGAIALPTGGYLSDFGGRGRLRLAIANAELGLPTGLHEPEPGVVLVVSPEQKLVRRVNLRGAEVVA